MAIYIHTNLTYFILSDFILYSLYCIYILIKLK